MQRYRANTRLLLILVVGVIVTSALAYGGWRIQINLNADDLIKSADESESEGRLIKARDSLMQYVSIRNEDVEARIRLANIAKKIVEDGGASREDRNKAYSLLLTTVRDTNDPELRRELVDTHMAYGQVNEALLNINELLVENPDDPELLALKVRCLFGAKDFQGARQLCYELIGYDPKTKEFDAASAKAPENVEIYIWLATHLRSLDDEDEEELADRIVEQMVEFNQDSADAHLQNYLVQIRKYQTDSYRAKARQDQARREAERIEDDDEREAALAEVEREVEQSDEELAEFKATAMASLEKAYEIDPDSENVLTYKGLAVRSDEDFETALELFRKGKKQYPENADFVFLEATTLIADDQREAALKVINAGLDKFELQRALKLSDLKVDLLLEAKDYEPIEGEIRKLEKIKSTGAKALADYHRARIAFQKGKWLSAAKQFQSVGPRLSGFSDLREKQKKAGVMQAICYRNLGQHDVALSKYRQVLESAPDYAPAIKGKEDIERAFGKVDEGLPTNRLDQMVAKNLGLPEDEQDWQEIQEYIEKVVRDRKLPESRQLLLEAQVQFLRGNYRNAEEKIREAFKMDPEDLTTRLAAVRLLQLWPGKGPAIALKLMDQIVERFGDTATMRIMRADLLAAAKDENLSQQLMSMTDDMDAFTKDEQAQVWSSVGARFQQLGLYEEAWKCLENAIELKPDQLPLRVFLFEIALSKQDDALMQEAQARLVEFLKDDTEPVYVLTEVKRRMLKFATNELTAADLKETRKMLDRALDRRESWHELRIASGQLAMLEKDFERSMREFRAAANSGPMVANAVVLLAKLLAQHGQFEEAYENIQLLPLAKRTALLGRLEADVLQEVGRDDEAFESAEALSKMRPNDAAVQAWFAEIARKQKKFDVAEEAMHRALDLRGDLPDYWSQLISIHYEEKDAEKVFDVLRDAALSLDAEYLPLLAAKNYELQGRWQAAEDIYLKAYAKQLDAPGVARALADFYIRWQEQDEDNLGKAAVHLNRILRAANNGEIKQTDPNAMWARRRAARILATSGSYRDSIKAEKMLRMGMEAATDKEEIAGQLADVLSSRGDPASRLEAVKLFEEIKDETTLTKAGDMRLAQLLFDVGLWNECKAHMLDVVSRYPNDPNIRTKYINMLLERREFQTARRQLTQLSDVESAGSLAYEFRTRLAAAEGNRAEVRKMLENLTPDARVLDKEKTKFLLAIAALSERVEDYEYAERVLKLYLRRNPSESIHLARLISLHGDPEQGVELLAKEFDGNIDTVVQFAVQMLRRRRAEIGDRVDAQVEAIINRALKDDPDSASRLVLRAEMLETQEKYDEAIEAYESILKRDDLPTTIHATTNNNLAFIYALTKQNVDRALTLVNDAIDMVGPLSDILDTRAVVFLALDRGSEAVADMQMAIRIGPTASKYFHLAQAEFLADNPQGALKAWEQGVVEGLDSDEVTALEQDDFEDLQRQINALQSSNAAK